MTAPGQRDHFAPERPPTVFKPMVGPLSPRPDVTLAEVVAGMTDAARAEAWLRSAEAAAEHDEWVCPVCRGARTVQPDPCTPPEPCPRCVDEDADA